MMAATAKYELRLEMRIPFRERRPVRGRAFTRYDARARRNRIRRWRSKKGYK